MEPLYSNQKIEIWGGLECSFNRVQDLYFDQLDSCGHYHRDEDIELIAQLGIKKIRYPIIWEKHQPLKKGGINWSLTEKNLHRFRELGIDVIAGLVHHGGGPVYAGLQDKNFAEELASYAEKVAEKFPWIQYYTPVNEPLTTARFSGLYGIWHPHTRNDNSFLTILLNECRGVVLAMKAIRMINPEAKLIQTEDLGKVYSTPPLAYQADFENHRRWLSFDLLCGKLNPDHPLWNYFSDNGISESDLRLFIENPCFPDIIGINHYLTSERYLDENIRNYPKHTHGSNIKEQYADVEMVRVKSDQKHGLEILLQEVWDRYKIPLAVTEVHLHCSRDEQMRWLKYVRDIAQQLYRDGVDIIAISPWAIMGSYGWEKLLTEENGTYETGVFDIRSGKPRPTILAEQVKSYCSGSDFDHPVLESKGWWQCDKRIIYPSPVNLVCPHSQNHTTPVLITGKTGTLGRAFARLCELRGIGFKLLCRDELNIESPEQIDKTIREKKPWAIINTAGFVRVDDAEDEPENCFNANTSGPENLAMACQKYGVKLVTFSSDLVFNGQKNKPYLESDDLSPLNIYGMSKALAEQKVLKANPTALVIRSSGFFGPWDQYNFAFHVLNSMAGNKPFQAAADVYVSPTYVPDLVNASLDLLLDGECGVWNLANEGEISWADFATEIVSRAGGPKNLVQAISIEEFGFRATRPKYSVLRSGKGFDLAKLDNAISRYFSECEML